MKLFLTGATGFIGRHVLERLKDKGHEILLLTREPGRVPPEFKAHVKILTGDMGHLDDIEKDIAAFAPDTCLHLAWEGLPDYSKDACEKNRITTTRLFNILVDKTKCRKIVAVGSSWEYTSRTGALKEDARNETTSDFTQVKKQLLNCGMALANTCDIQFLWMRLFDVFGPRQNETALIPSLALHFKKEGVAEIPRPDNAYDFIYVTDAARAIADAVEREIPNGVYNVGSGRATSVQEICGLIEKKILGNRKTSDALQAPTDGDAENYWADTEKIKKALAWEPATSVAEGIEMYLEFLSPAAEEPGPPTSSLEELIGFIREFFRRLDRQDFKGVLELFERDSDIAHFDGVITSPLDFVKGLRQDGMAIPENRSLTDFRGDIHGDHGWIAYHNSAVFANGEHQFQETAVLRRSSGGWKFVRVHYSGGRQG